MNLYACLRALAIAVPVIGLLAGRATVAWSGVGLTLAQSPKDAVQPPGQEDVSEAGEPEIAADASVADTYPERRTVFPGGVTGLADLTYATPPGFRPLTLDLYLPPDSMPTPPAGFPVVVQVHGGGWMAGDARHSGSFVNFPEVLASLAAKGYVVASINYRLSSEAKSPAAVLDLKTAIRWLRAKATDYRVDPTRAAVWGASSGGQLAGLAAVTCKVEAFSPEVPPPPGAVDPEGRPVTSSLPDELMQQSDCVQAAVTWYGVFDFATIAEQLGVQDDAPVLAPEAAFLGCDLPRCPPGLVAGASSTTYVNGGANGGAPPMLLIHGMSDSTVPHEQSEEMAAKLEGAGVPAELLLIPDVGQNFVGKSQAATRAGSLRALHATFDFFDRSIGPQRAGVEKDGADRTTGGENSGADRSTGAEKSGEENSGAENSGAEPAGGAAAQPPDTGEESGAGR